MFEDETPNGSLDFGSSVDSLESTNITLDDGREISLKKISAEFALSLNTLLDHYDLDVPTKFDEHTTATIATMNGSRNTAVGFNLSRIHRIGDVLRLERIYVAEQFRRQGIGTFLFNDVLRTAIENEGIRFVTGEAKDEPMKKIAMHHGARTTTENKYEIQLDDDDCFKRLLRTHLRSRLGKD